MSESSFKNGFSAVNTEGQIIDEDIARQMADKESKLRKKYTKEYTKEMSDLTKEELEATIAPTADKAAEDIFKKETGMEYADAVKEAQEAAAYEINAVENSAKGETDKDVKIIKQNPGAEGEDNSDAKKAVENYQDVMRDAKTDSETNITSVVSNVETKETNQDRLNKVKKEVEKRVIEIQETIDILDGKKGGRGEVLTYLKKAAGIEDRNLTKDEEKKYWGRAMYRLKAEKQGYEVVDLFFENNDSPADWGKFQKHLQFSLKSEKNLVDEYVNKIKKDPAVSNQNKPIEQRIKEVTRDSKAIQDVISGFIDKNDKKKDGSKPTDKPDASVEVQSPTEGDTQKPSKNPTELKSDEAEASHKIDGPVYANESIPDDAQDAAERIKNGKKAKKSEEKESGEKKEEPKEKTAEEILREKNIETYGGTKEFKEVLDAYKLLNDLVDKGANQDGNQLFEKWDDLRLLLANKNTEIMKKMGINMDNIENDKNSWARMREFFDKKMNQDNVDIIEKDSNNDSLIFRAVALIIHRNEVAERRNNCVSSAEVALLVDEIKDIDKKINILDGKLLKYKKGESSLNDLLINGFQYLDSIKKTEFTNEQIDSLKAIKILVEKEPEYKGGYPAVIEGEKPRTEMTAEQTARVESALKEFNLTAEDAEKIEGFKDLSYGQRLLALENLKQITLKDTRLGALREQKEEAGQTKGFFKKIWKSIKKKYDIAKHEKSIYQNLTKDDYAETLAQLARGMKEFKTDVVEKDGKLEFQYVSGLENLTPEQAARVQRFNEVASELSKMPMEWTTDDGKKGYVRQIMDKVGLGQTWSPDDPTRGQYNRCQELTTESQSLKQEVIQIIKQQKDADLKKGGVEKFDDLETQSSAMAQMLQIENLLRYNRTMNTNPDAEKALLEIKTKKLWTRALNNILTEKGIYFAAGFASRSVAMIGLGTIGLPIAAIGLGGTMGYKRGKESLREQDALAQHNAFEETKAIRIKKFELQKYGKPEPINKKEKKQEKRKARQEKIEKRIEDANVLARNLNNFVEYIGKEDDPKRQMDLARRLRDRVKFVKDALDEGRINFGSAKERLTGIYELTDKLNTAVSCVEVYHPSARHEADQWSDENQSKVMKELDRHLESRKEKLDAERKKYLLKQMATGAVISGAFVGGGMAAREIFTHLDPHLVNQQGEWDIGGRWISDKGGSGKPLVGGIVGKYMHGEPGGGGGGYESGKGPDMFPGEKYFGVEASSGKANDLVEQFYEKFRYHPEWESNLLEQGKALQDLTQQLEAAGVKDPDALKEIIFSVKDQLNGDGKIFIGGSQEAQNLAGIESTGGSGGSSTAEQTATAAGAGKSVDAIVGAKTEAAQFINEIKNVGGIKHDSIWRSTHDLIQSKAKELGLEYPGVGKTKLAETDWYNAKTSQLVNELDKSTPGGIKDLVHEGDKIALTKGGDGEFHLSVEESSGINSGRLADLHHHIAETKAPAIENASSVPESAPIHPEPIWEPMINEPQATDHPWDNRPKQAAGNRLNEIFDYPFGRQGAETMTYQNVKGDSAEVFLKRDFFKEIAGNHELDISEKDALMHDVTKYRELQNYLNDMAKKPGNYPRTGETVDQFIHRLNRDIVATPEHAVPDAAPGETAPVPEAQNKIEIDKIDEDFFKENQAVDEVFKGPEVIAAAKPIHLSRDNFYADIQFKYNQSGEPISVDWIDAKIDGVRGSEYYEANYLKTIAKGFKEAGFALENEARENASKAGRHLMELIKIHDELIIQGEKQEATVLLDQIKEEIGIINTRYGHEIINSEKLPQEIREKLGK